MFEDFLKHSNYCLLEISQVHTHIHIWVCKSILIKMQPTKHHDKEQLILDFVINTRWFSYTGMLRYILLNLYK